jgi:hypothetical protein
MRFFNWRNPVVDATFASCPRPLATAHPRTHHHNGNLDPV